MFAGFAGIGHTGMLYLICYAIKMKIDQLTSVRRMLLKVNIIAVIMLVLGF